MSFEWGKCYAYCSDGGICMAGGDHEIHDTGVHQFSEEEAVRFEPSACVKGVQCFCGDNATALPIEPLEAHGSNCLVWDWVAANGRISRLMLNVADDLTVKLKESGRK